MAKLTLDIPDNQVARLLKIADAHGYQSKIEQYDAENNLTIVDNPESKVEFIRKLVIRFLRTELLQAERMALYNTASVDDVNIT